MATQNAAPFVGIQQQLLDSAKGQLALVRVAVDKSNQAIFDAAQEYFEIAQGDVALVAGDQSPAVSDFMARGFDRTAQLFALQEKVLRGLSDAWTPVVEKAVTEATTWAESSRTPTAATSEPKAA
jgi:hypothetical protein